MQTYTKLENYKNFITFQKDLGIDFFTSVQKQNATIDLNVFNSIKTIKALDSFVKKHCKLNGDLIIKHNKKTTAKLIVLTDNLETLVQGDFPFVGQSLSMFEKMFGAIDLSISKMFVLNFCFSQQNKKYLCKANDDYADLELIIFKYVEIIKPKFIVDMRSNNKIDFKFNKLGKGLEFANIPNPATLINYPALKKKAWENLKRLREKINAN